MGNRESQCMSLERESVRGRREKGLVDVLRYVAACMEVFKQIKSLKVEQSTATRGLLIFSHYKMDKISRQQEY